MEFLVIRDVLEPAKNGEEGFSLGLLSADGIALGYTLEDEDRRLELDSRRKVFGRSAIPRGRFELRLSYSPRFKRVLPELVGVPGFVGVRIHGANEAKQLEGCLGVGRVRTAIGVAKCAPVVDRVIALLQEAATKKQTCWITIK